MTLHERTNWRDMDLSRRHRTWGESLPAVDADFLLFEYDHSEIVAIIDYKHHQKYQMDAPDYSRVTIDEWSLRAIRNTANLLKIPFCLAVYWPGTWSFMVIPINQYAIDMLNVPTVMTEREYVEWLYSVRKRSPRQTILEPLNDCHPPEWRGAA